MLILLILLFVVNANAGYLNVGTKNQEYNFNSMFYANGFIIHAETDKGGAGFGFQQKDTEVYAVLGYDNNNIYGLAELVYKNGRHSMYDLSLIFTNEKQTAKIGFTWLLSENFGFIAKHNFTDNQLFIGVRKWIR